MAAGALIANGASLVRGDPWKRMVLPTSTEILRLHLFVLVMPVVTVLKEPPVAKFGVSPSGPGRLVSNASSPVAVAIASGPHRVLVLQWQGALGLRIELEFRSFRHDRLPRRRGGP
jgi:hypothetical protein